METQNTAYVLDNQNRITSVIGAWDTFAAENGGAELSLEDVRGRSIWDFVAGEATRMWLETVFQFARLGGTPIERSYRCDSPDVKRFMCMRIVPEQGGSLRIEHEVLSTEHRAAPVHIQYGSAAMKNMKKRCSVCGCIYVNGWQEPHENFADASNYIIVIYTVCEDCHRLMPGML